jgi:hypothetical protein
MCKTGARKFRMMRPPARFSSRNQRALRQNARKPKSSAFVFDGSTACRPSCCSRVKLRHYIRTTQTESSDSARIIHKCLSINWLSRMDSNHDKVIQSHLWTAGLASRAFWSVNFESKKLPTCERKIASSRFQRLDREDVGKMFGT